MGAAGILGEDDRVELIEGEIVDMSPIGIRHIMCVNRLTRLLVESVGDHGIVSPQNPIRTSDLSEPQPDLAVLRNRDYDAVPTAVDVLLLVEVSDSTRDYNVRTKIPLYARAGIPEAWIADLTLDVIFRHTEPQSGVYQRVESFERGDTIVSVSLPSVALSVEAILG
jgi:Uma2 family endonuclease